MEMIFLTHDVNRFRERRLIQSFVWEDVEDKLFQSESTM